MQSGTEILTDAPTDTSQLEDADEDLDGLSIERMVPKKKGNWWLLPKNTRMGGNNVTFNITTPNAQSFMDSRGQIMAKFAGEMQRSRTRNS